MGFSAAVDLMAQDGGFTRSRRRGRAVDGGAGRPAPESAGARVQCSRASRRPSR